MSRTREEALIKLQNTKGMFKYTIWWEVVQSSKPQVRTTKSVEEDEATQVGDDEEPLTQLRTLWAKIGKGAFLGALDEMVMEEDF